MKKYSPNTDLEPFVECYWSWEMPSGAGELCPILPDAAPELIVHLSTPPFALRDTGQWEQQPVAFLLCASRRSVRLTVESPMEVFAIRFRPWGVSRFTERPMTELVDREVPLCDVFPSFARLLANRITQANSHSERVNAADASLLAALSELNAKDEFIRRLHDHAVGGFEKGRDLAAALDVSERTLRRRWQKTVGIEQRKFVSLMRFHRALGMIDAGEALADVAVDCGYTDQSHLARDIKSISGLPSSLLRPRLNSDTYQALYGNRPSAPWKRTQR